MDHGKIIALGLPNELLAKYFDDMVVELPKKNVPAAYLKKIPHTVNKDRIQFVTEDINAMMATLVENKISLADMKVRTRNLEDLFLELTGKDLRA